MHGPAREAAGRTRTMAKGEPTPMTDPEMSREDVLRVKLELLRAEHRDLDDAIAALDLEARADPLAVRRLKKRKLMLKDEITRLSDELTPDIIA